MQAANIARMALCFSPHPLDSSCNSMLSQDYNSAKIARIKEVLSKMNTLNCHSVKPGIAASTASRFRGAASLLKRRLPATVALLTLCFVALDPQPSMAAEKGGGQTKTTVKLKASGTSITTATLFHLTATVSPTNATGTVTFYCIQIPPSRIWIPFAQIPVIAGVANKSALITFPGRYGFKAEYDGSKTYATSDSNDVTVLVKNSKSFSEPAASPAPLGLKTGTCWK